MKLRKFAALLCLLSAGAVLAQQSSSSAPLPRANDTTRAKAVGNFEIISDTHGFDFAPYLTRVRNSIIQQWFNLVPDEVRPPVLKSGKVLVKFTIMSDGSVEGETVQESANDEALDKAAFGAIHTAAPFPPLPQGFSGHFVSLRASFYYNPKKGDLDKK